MYAIDYMQEIFCHQFQQFYFYFIFLREFKKQNYLTGLRTLFNVYTMHLHMDDSGQDVKYFPYPDYLQNTTTLFYFAVFFFMFTRVEITKKIVFACEKQLRATEQKKIYFVFEDAQNKFNEKTIIQFRMKQKRILAREMYRVEYFFVLTSTARIEGQ